MGCAQHTLAFGLPPPRGAVRCQEATACCPRAAPQGEARGLENGHPHYRRLQATRPRGPRRSQGWAAAVLGRSRLDWRELAGTHVPGGPTPAQGVLRSRSNSTSLVCRFTLKGGSLLRFTLSPVVPGMRARTRCVSR